MGFYPQLPNDVVAVPGLSNHSPFSVAEASGAWENCLRRGKKGRLPMARGEEAYQCIARAMV